MNFSIPFKVLLQVDTQRYNTISLIDDWITNLKTRRNR